MMEKGELDLAVHNGPDAMNVILGLGAYAEMGPKPFIRTLVAGTDYNFLVHTTPRTGIRTLADLKGRTVYTRLPGNPMFDNMLNAKLGAAGLKESDLRASMTMPNVREATKDLIEGRADAILYPTVPSVTMEINQAAGECVFISPSDEEAKAIVAALPKGFFVMDIPANSQEVRNISPVSNAPSFRNVMFARVDMDPALAYAIVKAVIDNRAEWENVHPQAQPWGTIYSSAPAYHEGAIRYYQEKGMWNAETAASHAENLQIAEGAAKK